MIIQHKRRVIVEKKGVENYFQQLLEGCKVYGSPKETALFFEKDFQILLEIQQRYGCDKFQGACGFILNKNFFIEETDGMKVSNYLCKYYSENIDSVFVNKNPLVYIDIPSDYNHVYTYYKNKK